jgi:hypothetical protein
MIHFVLMKLFVLYIAKDKIKVQGKRSYLERVLNVFLRCKHSRETARDGKYAICLVVSLIYCHLTCISF